jgi:flagellar motor component MotA
MRWSAIIGGVMVAVMASCAILLGSHLLIFVDTTTALLMMVLPLCFLLQAHGVAGLKTAQRAAACWLSRSGQPPERLADAICVVGSGSVATTKGSLICVLIGAIQMLQNMTDPSAIGPAVAVMLLSYFYGHCINFIFWWPLGRWLKQHLPSSEGALPA